MGSVLSFLLSNILFYLLELKPDGRDRIASRPEVLAAEVSLLARELSGDGNGTLALEKSDD